MHSPTPSSQTAGPLTSTARTVPGPGSTALAPVSAAGSSAAVDTAIPTPDANLQGSSLALARILGRIVTALDLLTGAEGLRSILAPPGTEPASEALTAVREELRLARTELTPLQGSGDALLSSAGRAAKSQQRTDPAHAPSFGG